MNYHQR